MEEWCRKRTRILYWIRKGCDHAEFELLLGIVAWHIQQRPAIQLLLLHLK